MSVTAPTVMMLTVTMESASAKMTMTNVPFQIEDQVTEEVSKAL